VHPVAEPEILHDPADPRLADYRDLTDTALRRRIEPEGGLFIAEGELVVRRARESGFACRSLLLAENRVAAVGDLLDEVSGPVYVGSSGLLQELTGFHVHRGVLAAMQRRPEPTVPELLAGVDGRPPPRRICVLEELSNPTNLGAVFRSAAALGIDGVLLAPTCGDPLYRRSVRVSMGEVFALPYARLTSWPDDLELLRGIGFRVLALTPDEQATPLDRLALGDSERIAVLFGAEGPGLSVPALAAADGWVRIPMAGGVDSLNVAAAAAVTFWVLGKR
jgi:tRNA G18 (ribose-2'-O)-methylase SpoU